MVWPTTALGVLAFLVLLALGPWWLGDKGRRSARINTLKIK